MNPYVIETLLREKREDLLREAERQRLIARYEAANPSKKAIIMTALGRKLVNLGEKLQERYGRDAQLTLTARACSLKH